MRKTLHNLIIAIILQLIIISCSKDKTDSSVTPPPACTTCPCITCPTLPAPSGTVAAADSSIGYGETATFSYHFNHADIGVWIGGKLMNDTVVRSYSEH